MLAICALASLGLGCGGGSQTGPDGSSGTTGTAGTGGGSIGDLSGKLWPAKQNRMLDVLFMVDNSVRMAKLQAKLGAAIPAFIEGLKDSEGLPDLHIGVVTSDMPVRQDNISGCSFMDGDNGAFKYTVGAGATDCTATGLAAGAKFISTTGGATPQNNFTGDLAKVLQCIVPVGTTGCNYQQQLKAVVRALGADGFSGTTPEFLRPDAALAVILVTWEDDCSAADPESFYDGGRNSPSVLTSPLGPSGNFRCTEFGHLCTPQGGGAAVPPQRSAPNGMVTDTITYDSCVSAEGRGQLVPVADFAARLKVLKAVPEDQILVASLSGPTTPYQVHWKAASVANDPPWPELSHACTASDQSVGDPSVRVQQLTQQFGDNGFTSSICNDDFGPSLNTMGVRAKYLLPHMCITGTLADADGKPETGVQPTCMVYDRTPNPPGDAIFTSIAACVDGGTTRPCWRLATAGLHECPSNSHKLEIDRGGAEVGERSLVWGKCEICKPGEVDAVRGCFGT